MSQVTSEDSGILALLSNIFQIKDILYTDKVILLKVHRISFSWNTSEIIPTKKISQDCHTQKIMLNSFNNTWVWVYFFILAYLRQMQNYNHKDQTWGFCMIFL